MEKMETVVSVYWWLVVFPLCLADSDTEVKANTAELKDSIDVYGEDEMEEATVSHNLVGWGALRGQGSLMKLAKNLVVECDPDQITFLHNCWSSKKVQTLMKPCKVRRKFSSE
ncbi:uncharacterized protein [Halyomorpha halys]|uniref:uncharacterized protein n=1 Tax=Halyomorpha halys TaxID=286706 RepID=UPI0034D35282